MRGSKTGREARPKKLYHVSFKKEERTRRYNRAEKEGRKKAEKPRVGVFVCHCGTNIAKTVDVNTVASYARKIPGVIFSKDSMFMCSEDGQNLIKESVKKNRLNRVVIASCSPKLHEVTFRRLMSAIGLNPYFLEMANLREGVAWVHSEHPGKATKKAQILVRGAVERAKRLEPIEEVTVPVEPSVLIIGGGVAGIQAALDVSNMGIRTYIVEKRPSIGGNMARLVKTFPTGDCALCILSPKIAEVGSEKNIQVFSYSEITGVEGYVGNFNVNIKVKPKYIEEGKCIACGLCSEKCPVKVPNEWDLGLGYRKAVYMLFPQAFPRIYIIDEKHCLKLTKNKCGICEKVCPAGAINYNQHPRDIELRVGAIIVATGTDEFNPRQISRYNLSAKDDVVTQLQLARMLDPSGPTGGKVLRISDGKEPKKYLMIQCVGSRDEKYNPYCSKVCCMAALKHAMMLKLEQNPDAEIYICHMDVRSAGKGYEEYYKGAGEMGIKFIRGCVAELSRESAKLVCLVEDTNINEIIKLEADMVVLSPGLVPSDEGGLARILRLGRDAYGFLSEKHPKLAPVDTNNDGIFICGTVQSPKDIQDSVAQAKAAASSALSIVSKKELAFALAKASVKKELCNGCLICYNSCPYGAIKIEGEKPRQRVSVVEVVCKGCGTCAAECPTGAMELKHYKKEQVLSQIYGLCRVARM